MSTFTGLHSSITLSGELSSEDDVACDLNFICVAEDSNTNPISTWQDSGSKEKI